MKPVFDSRATTAYYDTHAAEFCGETASLDMKELYAPFLRELPAGGHILDAGCGSGRDSRAFLQIGYHVVSFDASRQMVLATTKLTGREALLMTFDAMDFDAEFDGIWACASLLHVPRRDLNSVLNRFTKALKPDGVCYLSFKYGDDERMENGRFFNDLNERLVGAVIAAQKELEPVNVWRTSDVRKEHKGRLWLNALVRRHACTDARLREK